MLMPGIRLGVVFATRLAGRGRREGHHAEDFSISRTKADVQLPPHKESAKIILLLAMPTA